LDSEELVSIKEELEKLTLDIEEVADSKVDFVTPTVDSEGVTNIRVALDSTKVAVTPVISVIPNLIGRKKLFREVAREGVDVVAAIVVILPVKLREVAKEDFGEVAIGVIPLESRKRWIAGEKVNDRTGGKSHIGGANKISKNLQRSKRNKIFFTLIYYAESSQYKHQNNTATGEAWNALFVSNGYICI
jgi:hypothetical protein